MTELFNSLEKLRNLRKAYKIANKYFYGDIRISKEEYLNNIGEYKNMQPNEILQLMFTLIDTELY